METAYSYDDFKKYSDQLLEWLSAKGRECRFVPVLEFDALNRYVYGNDFLERLLEKFDNVKLCLDTARLYLQDRIDPFFDAELVLRKYAGFAHMIHLSNVQIASDQTILKSRYPVLPDQRPSEGWAPIQRYLHTIRQRNENVSGYV